MSGITIIAVLTLISCLTVPALCQTHIDMYLEFQFQGNPHRTSLRQPNKCEQVHLLPQFPVKSVRSQFCVLLYSTEDCSGNWIKQLRGNDGVSLEKPPTPEDPNNYYPFHSWFPCNKSFDGGQIHVTIDGSLKYYRSGYSDVCECHNFGSTADYKYIAAEGNCLKVFEKEECRGRSQQFPNLFNHSYPLYINSSKFMQTTKVSMSFSPCMLPRSCSFISGTIFRVDLYPSIENQTSGYVDRQPRSVYTKNTTKFIEFYGSSAFKDATISLTPRQLVGIWRKNKLDEHVYMTNNTKIPTFDDEKWRERFLRTLPTDFGYAPTFLNFPLKRNVSFTTTRPTVERGHYIASASIVIQKEVDVPYIVHMKVSGTWGSGLKMLDHELIEKMPEDVQYISSTNATEIYIQIKGYIFANFVADIEYNITEVKG